MLVKKSKAGAPAAGHRSQRATRFPVKRAQDLLNDRRELACRRFQIIAGIAEITDYIPKSFQRPCWPHSASAAARIQRGKHRRRGYSDSRINQYG